MSSVAEKSQINRKLSALVLMTSSPIRNPDPTSQTAPTVRETLINGPTSEVAGEMASNFLDDEAN
ncbi:hypothetical protein, partial [Burkholderia multivorans]|uniref:hypothetical protein n=1 Tax=Burkholderia multivorans TaxID=87883 RepID=UPI001E3FEF34